MVLAPRRRRGSGPALRAYVSVAWRHVNDDPVNAVVLATRVVPGRVKRPLEAVLSHPAFGWAPTTRSLALWDRGRRAEARAVVTRAVSAGHERGATRRIRRLAALSLALQEPRLAAPGIEALPSTDPARPRLEALLLWQQGDLRAAVEVIRRRPSEGMSRRQRIATLRTFQRLTDDLAAMNAQWPVQTPATPAPIATQRGRVLHLVTNSLPHKSAGYTVRTHKIALSQQEIGLDPHVVTQVGFPVAQGAYRSAMLDTQDGVPYHRLLPAGYLPRGMATRMTVNVAMASDLVERLRPSVLHAASNHVNGQLALALRDRYGLPVVYEVRGFLEDTWLSRDHGGTRESDRYLLSRAVETRCMQDADLVVTLGEVMKEEIVGRGVPRDRVIVVPNAVDARFLEPPPDPVPTRRRLGIPDDAVVVGVVTSFVPYEGLDHLVRAAALAREQGIPIRLLLVGDGTDRPRIVRLVHDLRLQDVTTMPGRVPHAEVRHYHAAIDVFAVPRTDDRVCHMVTPLKPFEAMAIGRPVVASRVRALREIVTEGKTGLLFPPGDEPALAEALATLAASAERRAEMGAAARDWVASSRTWRHNAERYRDAYQALGAV